MCIATVEVCEGETDIIMWGDKDRQRVGELERT